MSGRKSFIAHLHAKSERRAEFDRLLGELLSDVRANLPGTVLYEILRDDQDPLHVVFVASFTNEEAFERHMHSEGHDRLVPPLLDCLAVPMDLAFFTSLA